VSALTKAVSPRGAVRYARHPSGGLGLRSLPFVIWLVIGLGLLMALRRTQGNLTTISTLWQAGSPMPAALLTYLVVGFGIVLAATIAPEIVTWALLLAFLLAVLIDVPYITPALDWLNGKVSALTPA
jgi:hypothetical protein